MVPLHLFLRVGPTRQKLMLFLFLESGSAYGTEEHRAMPNSIKGLFNIIVWKIQEFSFVRRVCLFVDPMVKNVESAMI